MTHLLEALLNCNINKVKAYLEKEQDVNCTIPGTEGCTPLHIIVGMEHAIGKENIMLYLLGKGADPNARSYDDLTPMHIAAMWNNCNELETLLQNGGNPWLTDNENKNSFDMAADNYSYEAYQLLNRYLAEDKLNFKLKKPKSHSSLNTLKELTKYKEFENESKDHVTNSLYISANENFPLFFSSSEDETRSFIQNINKFLKRKSIKKIQNKDQNTKCQNNSAAHSHSLNSVPNEDCEHIFSSNDMQDKSVSDEDKNSEEKTGNSDFNNAYILSTDDNSSVPPHIFDSSETDTSDTVIYSDVENGFVLVERYSSPLKIYLSKSDDSIYSTASDWKSYRTDINNVSMAENNCSWHSESSVIISDDLQKFSNSKIFQELEDLGDNPGPVLDHTRNVYLRRLARLKSGCKVSCPLPEPKYCPEIYLFLEGKLDVARIEDMEKIVAEEFENSSSSQKWREGNQRCCFNYFLLDPRVTQNLPARVNELTMEKAFMTFLDSLFYVGKGTRGRPYSHLLEAAKAMTDTNLKSEKVTHILDIWKSGLGVISLHCYNNLIPVEAYTREACIIEAIGLSNLTNVKCGDFYGITARWTKSRKRQIGIFLLYKAFKIFILEGERQIRAKDIRGVN